MELEQLKFERDVFMNSIQRMADCSSTNESEFKVRIKELNNVKKQFFLVQGKIEKLLAKSGEFKPEEQLEIRNNFDDLYYKVQITADQLKTVERRQSVASVQPTTCCHGQGHGRDQLPVIKLPTFDGQVTDWHAFYDLYLSLVHNNESLSNVERFRYLRLSLRGEPYSLIKSIPITGDNYNNALQVLLDEYQNNRIIASKHLDKILDVDPVTDKNYEQSLRNILIVYKENITALKNFDLPVTEWSFILLNILLRKITPILRKRFELSLKSHNDIPSVNSLIEFLNKEVNATEAMCNTSASRSVASSTEAAVRQSHSRAPLSHAGGSSRRVERSHSDADRTATSMNNTSFARSRDSRSMSIHAATSTPSGVSHIMRCFYCKQNSHPLNKCVNFSKLTLSERKNFIEQNKVCYNCLFTGHELKDCKSRHNCRVCSQRHHTSMHEDVPNVILTTECNVSSPELTSVAEPSYLSTSQHGFSGHKNNCTVLLTTALINIRPSDASENPPRLVRALVDQGSQATLIAESCVQRLGLKRYHAKTSMTITGIGNKNEQPRGYVLCEVTPYNKPEPKLFIEALILPKLTSYLPSIPSFFEHIPHLKDLPLADPELRSARPVELLLGSDYTNLILLHDNIKGPQGTPVAINSIFGYLLNGKISHSLPAQVCMNVSTYQLDMQLQNFWELESVPDVKPLTREEALCESIFVDTHKRSDSGKYIVSLPFKEHAPPLGESRQIALNRLYKLEQKLSRDPSLQEEYSKCIRDYEILGHMEPVNEHTVPDQIPYYIPHHCVLKTSSASTKLRVVFDASCKTSNGRSLNDNLLVGQKLHKDINEVLLKFRLHKIVFTADIKMMYRFIQIRPEDRDFQRILWRYSPKDPVQDYRLCTVTFGVASAPFLALRTLRQLAIDEADSFPLASQVLVNDVFVDDVVSGSNTLDEAIAIQRELIAICKAGSFELRKWTSNCPEFLSSVSSSVTNPDDEALILSALDTDTTVKVLGLKWNPKSDTFSYTVTTPPETCTKRIMLSEISKIYDPLGFLSPITLFVKLLIQLLWISGTDWDEAPPKGIRDLWLTFISELPILESLSLPRHVIPHNNKEIQIHGFSDASEKAYAACVYLRVSNSQNSVHVNLILAKTKVAPLKRISLPRLELCGALLLSKLIQKLLLTYSNILSIDNVYAWSDSAVTLAWLRSSSHEWRTFVSNRVTETISRVPAAHWRHVRSEDNPADPASRGVLPTKLNHEFWFNGPVWLTQCQSNWPVSNIDLHTDEERRQHVLVSKNVTPDLQFMERFSSLPKLLRVVSFIFRFYHKCRKTQSHSYQYITVSETKFTLHRIIKLVQQDQFAEDISRLRDDDHCSNKLQKLRPFLDDTGLLRVGGRIQRAQIPYDAKHPIILPKRHHLTTLLIDHFHKLYLHVGPQTLQFLISQTYWIMSARDAVRMRTRRCVRCFRTRPSAPQPPMAPLPAARVNALRPFLHVSVDFAGHFYLKSTKFRNAKIYKSYICVFVCMSTKAVHLELVPDLSTDSFLNALRRFISRRGLCTDIYSDCGRNFVGCNNYLKELRMFLQNTANQTHINSKLTDLSITWHFNPPYASHFGGIFEAAVKSMKTHLYRVIGQLTLTHDEFNTLLCQIEAVLNSRPLCTQSNDPSDPLPLTPGHFLVGQPLTSLPEIDFSDDSVNRLVRWQIIQQAVQHFWKRWSVEYLSQLQQRSKWFHDTTKTPLEVGSVVVLIDNTLPPLQWRLARVHQLHPGADGITRVVTVRIGDTLTKRPVVKVCPLPIN